MPTSVMPRPSCASWQAASGGGRYGKADEIAGFVAYLASDEAAYVTGASLTVDGGFAA